MRWLVIRCLCTSQEVESFASLNVAKFPLVFVGRFSLLPADVKAGLAPG